MEITKTLLVKDKNEWRRWLERNHDKEKEIWVVFFRKTTGKQSMSYPEAIDEALSFGWIDSTEKGIDTEKFALRFTPRKPDSTWSKRTIAIAKKVIAEGKMTGAGFEKLPDTFRIPASLHTDTPGLIPMNNKSRCTWTGENPLMIRYHDEEWGVPVHDDLKLFEFLILEGAQAGLTWMTVLNKRENYRKAFSGFDPAAVARYSDADLDRLLSDPGIIRNRLKIRATIGNAEKFLAIQKEFGTFDAYIWQFVGGKPIINTIQSLGDIPSTTRESDAISKDLRKRGFTFVGSTICYAFMQAVGMVNDHQVNCFRYLEVNSVTNVHRE